MAPVLSKTNARHIFLLVKVILHLNILFFVAACTVVFSHKIFRLKCCTYLHISLAFDIS